MKLSQHFSRKEFACKCGCGFDTVDVETLQLLEDLRQHFNTPIFINSACRCQSHNRNVGGSAKSQHVRGRAADIDVADISPGVVYSYLTSTYPKKFGFGLYDNFIHVDTRSNGPARWEG